MTAVFLDSTVVTALSLTLLTAIATGIGSLLAFLPGTGGRRFVSAALGLSSGVMVYVSLVDILPESIEKCAHLHTPAIWAIAAFFLGMALMALLDIALPGHSMHAHYDSGRAMTGGKPADPGLRDRLRRTGIVLAATIAVHNFPEGMATFVSALESLEVAVPLTVAICIHNIPMGMAMSTPLYYGTCSRRKAFLWSMCSGMAAVAGAVFALLFLLPWWTPQVEALCMAAVAGVMLYIVFDELLPEAEAYGRHGFVMGGLVAGLAVMSLCLTLIGNGN